MSARRNRGESGFTLLEVLIASAILALGLSTIFGSSILASRGTAHARMVTQAGLLAQCRMTEVEAYLRMNGLPEGDNERIQDPPEMSAERCCGGDFTCDARVEKIELPQPADVQNSAGDRLLNSARGASSGSSFGGPGGVNAAGGDGGAPGGAISQLAGAFGALGGASGTGGLSSALGGAGGTLSGAGAPDMSGMAAQLLTWLYPTLKPLLEGAIRKVTVTVSWSEGSRRFTFDVVQYVTNPGQTMQSGDAMNAIERALGGGTGQPGTANAGTPPSTTPPTGGTSR